MNFVLNSVWLRCSMVYTGSSLNIISLFVLKTVGVSQYRL